MTSAPAPTRLADDPYTDPTPALPAWPLMIVLWGYPLFWMFGLLQFAPVIAALPMLCFLIMRRPIVLVPGILPWLGYALWMIPCMLMIDTIGRFIATGVQWSLFIAIAIAMVYIVNARESLPPSRVFNGLTFIWLFIILGGYLGLFFPEVRLTFTIGQVLPSFLAGNDYVRELVYPNFAEIQTPWGADEPFIRPSAPFPYTNGWGSGMAVLTPIVIGNVIGHRTARAVWFLVIAVIVAIPPAVATTNRGLFLGLAIGVIYVVVRLILRGKWLAMLWIAVLGLAVFLILSFSGLIDDILARQEVSDSTQGRGNLYAETFERTFSSPILGYGAPRPSLYSEINVGTQGAFWNAMFCFGFVGLALFVLALLSGALRTIDAPNLSTLWVHTSMVVALPLSLFYGLDRQLMFVAFAIAVLLREKYLGGRSNYWTSEPEPFGKVRRAA